MNELYKNKTHSPVEIFIGVHFYVPVESEVSYDLSNYLVIGLIFTLVTLGIVGSFISSITSSEAIPVRVVKAFSFWDNFKKIIIVPATTENENLLFLNGMRVLSIFWIVFGHDMWFRFMNIKNWMETI